MIPGPADGQGGSTAMQAKSTPLKRMSVGVKKAREAFNPCGVDKPAPSVMATNNKPISVAPAVAPTMKKFSRPWNIVVLKPEAAPSMRIIRRAPVPRLGIVGTGRRRGSAIGQRTKPRAQLDYSLMAVRDV
jgi:hypothetical protein